MKRKVAKDAEKRKERAVKNMASEIETGRGNILVKAEARPSFSTWCLDRSMLQRRFRDQSIVVKEWSVGLR